MADAAEGHEDRWARMFATPEKIERHDAIPPGVRCKYCRGWGDYSIPDEASDGSLRGDPVNPCDRCGGNGIEPEPKASTPPKKPEPEPVISVSRAAAQVAAGRKAAERVLYDEFTHVHEGGWNPPSSYVDVPRRFKGQRIHIQILGPVGGDHAGKA